MVYYNHQTNRPMKIRAFITHKKCEKYADCQDRFFISRDKKSIAVSDGMSQSFFPDIWAELLSKHYAENSLFTEKDIDMLAERWRGRVKEYIDKHRGEPDFSWRTESSFDEGRTAGATVCGVTFTDSGHWRGCVLGDSCIIKIKKNGTLQIYTSQQKPFDCYPDYYDSKGFKFGKGKIASFDGELEKGSVLLLVSDPFAEFIDNHKDDFMGYLKQIMSLENHNDFCKLVERWREEGMHNDDSTLCVIEPGDSSEFKVEHEDNINVLIAKEGRQGSEVDDDKKIDEIEKELVEKIVEQAPHIAKKCATILKTKKNKKKNKVINKIIKIIQNTLRGIISKFLKDKL